MKKRLTGDRLQGGHEDGRAGYLIRRTRDIAQQKSLTTRNYDL
jgi:hypothetical protein